MLTDGNAPQAVLGSFLNEVVPDLKALAEPLVTASVKIYQRIASELLPTPAKSHYTFNLRDLSKVFQGLLMVKAEHLDSQVGRSPAYVSRGTFAIDTQAKRIRTVLVGGYFAMNLCRT